MKLALPSLLAPSAAYMSLLATTPDVCIYTGERYEKQSLRNRFEYLASTGPLSTTVPIRKYPYPTPDTGSIRISEHGDWRPKLRHALTSAYSAAPFWEHYEETILRAIGYDESDLLVDYNHHWLSLLCAAWDIPFPDRVESLPEQSHFHPEIGDTDHIRVHTARHRYWQVFEQKFGFTPGLSALDLLLTQGPEGILYLHNLHVRLD